MASRLLLVSNTDGANVQLTGTAHPPQRTRMQPRLVQQPPAPLPLPPPPPSSMPPPLATVSASAPWRRVNTWGSTGNDINGEAKDVSSGGAVRGAYLMMLCDDTMALATLALARSVVETNTRHTVIVGVLPEVRCCQHEHQPSQLHIASVAPSSGHTQHWAAYILNHLTHKWQTAQVSQETRRRIKAVGAQTLDFVQLAYPYMQRRSAANRRDNKACRYSKLQVGHHSWVVAKQQGQCPCPSKTGHCTYVNSHRPPPRHRYTDVESDGLRQDCVPGRRHARFEGGVKSLFPSQALDPPDPQQPHHQKVEPSSRPPTTLPTPRRTSTICFIDPRCRRSRISTLVYSIQV